MQFRLLALLFSLTLGACVSTRSTDSAQSIPHLPAVTAGYEPVFEHGAEKVTGSSKMTMVLGLVPFGARSQANGYDERWLGVFKTIDCRAKSAAVFDACAKVGADALLAARFTTKIKNFVVFAVVECTVTGFPAKVTGVKKLKPYVLQGTEASSVVYLSEDPSVVK